MEHLLPGGKAPPMRFDPYALTESLCARNLFVLGPEAIPVAMLQSRRDEFLTDLLMAAGIPYECAQTGIEMRGDQEFYFDEFWVAGWVLALFTALQHPMSERHPDGQEFAMDSDERKRRVARLIMAGGRLTEAQRGVLLTAYSVLLDGQVESPEWQLMPPYIAEAMYLTMVGLGAWKAGE